MYNVRTSSFISRQKMPLMDISETWRPLENVHAQYVKCMYTTVLAYIPKTYTTSVQYVRKHYSNSCCTRIRYIKIFRVGMQKLYFVTELLESTVFVINDQFLNCFFLTQFDVFQQTLHNRVLSWFGNISILNKSIHLSFN